jgi:hypothetical protein
MFSEEELDAFLNYLEDEGILEWVGMTDNNERTFIFRFDIMKIKMPELYNAMMQELDDELLNLYRLGYVDIEYDENLNAGFRINEKGKQYLNSMGINKYEEFNDES